MEKLGVVVKNELIRYFISPVAYVYLIAFLVLNGSFAIYFGHFFERGEADLLPMFAYQPWLYLLFISGIAMRLWAEEFRSKTVVSLVSMPVDVSTLVWGKFWAAWLFAALALFLTFPFWITVNVLGHPDNMVIALGYLASWILAGCMLSVSQLMSALCQKQVIALVLSVAVNLLFFLCGLEYVLAFFRLFAPLSIIDMIASFSFLTHFSTMSAGVFEFRDFIFFASLFLLFNFTTILVVSFKTSGTTRLLKSASRNYYIVVFVLLLLGFGGINLAANNWTRLWRYDFTQQKDYTLSDTTQKIMQNLKRPIIAKLYYSRILEERNPQLREMFGQVRLLLAELRRLSDNKFDFKIYNPEPFSAEEDQALAQNILPVPVIEANQNAFFGLALSDDLDNRKSVAFFESSRAKFLEQDIVEKIFALQKEKRKVGILTDLPMFDDAAGQNAVMQEWLIVKKIKEFFDVTKVLKPEDLDTIDVLMIVHPKNLAPEMVKAVQDYTYGGGKLLVFADAAHDAERLYSTVNDDLRPSDFSLLEKLWGIQFHTEAVVADLENSIMVDATQNYKTNPDFTQDLLQFILKRKNINPNEAVTAQLNEIMMASATVIEPLNAAENRVEFIPLLTASDDSQVIPAIAAQQNFPAEVILQRFEADKYKKVLAAKVVSMNQASPFVLIAVADTDMLYDDFWAQRRQVLDVIYDVPLLDNANFVLNALEDLVGGESLAGLRGHAVLRRPFDKVEQMRKSNARQAKIQEAAILERINLAKTQLQEVWQKRDFEERQNFTADELALIAGIRKNLDDLKRELGAIKLNLNQNIMQIDQWVKFVNIYLMPILVLLCGAIWGMWAQKGRKVSVYQVKFKLDKSVVKIAFWALLFALMGGVSVHFVQHSEIEEYENKLLFPDLAQEINEVDRVVIRSHEAELKFYKQNGIWKLNNPADLPVYQERIRSLLSALLNARYFEKKTDDARYLKNFDLNPMEEKGSKNINLELQNEKGQTIVSLEVGRYDLDIGRGERAAYVKFADKFQVWLAAVDLIDITPDWLGWTFSSVWNLRYGRMQSFNDVSETDRIAELMKVLLNSYLVAEAPKPQNVDKFLSLDIKGEGKVRVVLDFYKTKDNYLVSYDIISDGDNEYLKVFARSCDGKYFVLSDESMERIEHVLKRRKE